GHSGPWRRGDVKAELPFLRIANEGPVISKGVLVVALQLVENQPARLSDTGRPFQQLHHVLRREATRQWDPCCPEKDGKREWMAGTSHQPDGGNHAGGTPAPLALVATGKDR